MTGVDRCLLREVLTDWDLPWICKVQARSEQDKDSNEVVGIQVPKHTSSYLDEVCVTRYAGTRVVFGEM